MSKKKKSSPKGTPKKRAKQPASQSRQKSILVLGLLLSALAFLLYANTLQHGFALDDGSAITENWVTKKGTEEMGLLLTKPYRYGYWNSAGVLYRPVSLLMFAIEWELSPDNPSLHHTVNVLLYAATAFLLFYTLARMMVGYHLLLPFFTSLLFLVHPIHVETVANIKSRDEMLAFFFSILALHQIWTYFDKRQLQSLVLALLSFTIALFSKEGVITFLAIFPLSIYFFHRKVSLVDNLKTSALFLVPALLYLAVRSNVLGDVAAGAGKSSPLDNLLFAAPDMASKLATAFLILGKYLITLFIPITLCSDYGFNQIPITTWADWRVLLALAVHAGMAIYAFKNLAKKDLLAYGILFYGITFSIYSNVLITIGSSYAERFLYIPSLGFALVVAVLLLKLLKVNYTEPTEEALDQWWSKYTTPLLVLAILGGLYGARTMARNPAWKNSYTLYTTDLPNSPNSAKLNYHQALETVKVGLKSDSPQEKMRLFDQAIKGFEKAISIYPNYVDAHGELGLVWFRKGNAQKAMTAYEEALKYNPKKATVYSNMGIIYFQQQNFEKAEEVYKKAVQYDPRFVDALRNLGSVYAMQKRFDEAIVQFNNALKYDPNSAILNFYLGSVYRDKGQIDLGQPYLNRAYALDPSLKK